LLNFLAYIVAQFFLIVPHIPKQIKAKQKNKTNHALYNRGRFLLADFLRRHTDFGLQEAREAHGCCKPNPLCHAKKRQVGHSKEADGFIGSHIRRRLIHARSHSPHTAFFIISPLRPRGRFSFWQYGNERQRIAYE
jgi:hypothetical protein